MDDLTALAGRISADLRTTRFGRPMHVRALVASTNDLARELAAGGAGEGTAVLALEQSHGRGRLGRRWQSPPGGLYLSIVLRPTFPIERWPLIGLACALAAASAAERHAGVPVRLKWPNDLLLDEQKKVGGILVEAAGDAAVCGIGLNVLPPTRRSTTSDPIESSPMHSGSTRSGTSSNSPAGPRDSLVPSEATWLGLWNPGLALESLVPDVLLECERRYQSLLADPEAVLAEWRTRAVTLGQTVHVEAGEPLDGVAEDIDAGGALLLRTSSGIRRVPAGDVSIVIRPG
jgi:BirA family biotin operon repressor/biotin-[acetyl-CoA-carboxylase] ligase